MRFSNARITERIRPIRICFGASTPFGCSEGVHRREWRETLEEQDSVGFALHNHAEAGLGERKVRSASC